MKVGPVDAVVLSGDFLSPSTLSALDGGKGMVAALRAVGVTHCCLGNHEADLKPPALQKRLAKLAKNVKILNSNIGHPSPQQGSAMSFLTSYPQHDVVSTSCGRVRVGLLGLLSDEPGMFRHDAFRGLPIANVLDAYAQLRRNELSHVDLALPLTHQRVSRDRDLARRMLLPWPAAHGRDTDATRLGLILGGHEHVFVDETVSDDDGGNAVRILKSGVNAEAVNVVDLTFDTPSEGAAFVLTDIAVEHVAVAAYQASVPVTNIVESHLRLLHDLEQEALIQHVDALLPPGVLLSTKRSRYRQTTGGGVLCRAIKEELDADVCVLNGAVLKGHADYPQATMSYADLKKELPFPTKMVVVPMRRYELQEAIHHSRTQPVGDGDEEPERKGFLQVDMEFDRVGFHTGDQDQELFVALPRNLLKGFCDIVPLVELGARLEAAGRFPAEDDFIPAIQLIIRHFCKERWYELVVQQDMANAFTKLDMHNKGYLSREDVQSWLHKTLGHEPADFVVTDMIAAMDTDDNGTIDPGEFSHLMAQVEREHGLVRFD